MRNIIKIAVGVSILGSVALASNHAIIIGCCDNYKYLKNIKQLFGTVNDANRMFDILVKEHKAVSAKNTILLTNEKATYHNITKSLKSMQKNNNLHSGDRLYIYYSGHGTSLFDSGYFGKKFKNDKAVSRWISDSTGLIPYDFNPKNMLGSMIITKRDFKPIFKKLDSRGINIVWITDACYAGNAYRGNGKTKKYMRLDTQNMVKLHSYDNKDPHYKHLLFYGASLATLPTGEDPYHGEMRGNFSVEVEKCLNKSYNSSLIRHKDLKKCLQANFANTQIQHNFYPDNNTQDNQIVMKSIKNPTLNRQSQPYKDRLFALQNSQPLLDINISSLRSSSQVIKTFCNREKLSVHIKNNKDPYTIALTKDSKGRVIMIQPDTKNKMVGNELFQIEVQPPFGTDRLKVFRTSDKNIYNEALKFADRPQGILSSADIERLYKALKSSGKFRTANMSVETIPTDIDICKKGD